MDAKEPNLINMMLTVDDITIDVGIGAPKEKTAEALEIMKTIGAAMSPYYRKADAVYSRATIGPALPYGQGG